MWWRKGITTADKVAIAAVVISIIGLSIGVFNLYRSEQALQEANNLIADETTIRQIINQEAIFSLNGQATNATSLYADNATITDAHGGNYTAVEIWSGKEAILKRYSVLPKFDALQHANPVVMFGMDKTCARAIADTIGTYENAGTKININSNQGEKWAFQKINGDWKILSFTYNLP